MAKTHHKSHARVVSRYKPKSFNIRNAVEAAGAAYLAHVAKKEFEKPSNVDTNLNLNSAFNATSLYSKTGRKKRKLSAAVKKKKIVARTFKKKVKKVLTKFVPWSTYTFNGNTNYNITGTPNSSITQQDVWGAGALNSNILLAYGSITDGTLIDVTHITGITESYGHVENNATNVPTPVNPFNSSMVKFYYRVRMEFDIYCQNVEINDANPLYIDIYECVAARNITDVNYASPGQAWTQCHADNADKATFTTDTVDYPNARGNTPAEAPGFSLWWKICQVTRIRIATSAPYHYKMFTGGLWDVRKNQGLYCVKGQTKGIILVGCPIQTLTLPVTWNIHVGGTSKHFKFKEWVLNGKDPIFDKKNTRFVGS